MNTLAQELERTNQEMSWRLCSGKVASFDLGPLLWLTQHTRTEDKHWADKGTQPIAPFPEKPYFPIVLRYLLERKRIFIPKTREMMTSWLVCGFVAWHMQWHPQVQWVLQSQKEDKAFELVDYISQLFRYQEPWMTERVPVEADNTGSIRLSNGSEAFGIPAGADQIRMYHPTGYVMDEAAHLAEAEQCYGVALPVARRIIAISSVAPGWFADECDLTA